VRCVYDICAAVSVPVVGIGGVTCGRDAVEMLMAGATAVGVGSAVYQGGPEVFGHIRDELAGWMQAHDYASLSEFRGIAHER